MATNQPVDMLKMDQTNRYPWGKILIHVNKVSNFLYMNNIFVKISLGPWVLSSRKIINEKLEFNQTFYIPTPASFVTLKIELINLQADGWFKEHFKEIILACYEIRLPDINKEPFDEHGNIVLPLPDIKESKKLGLQIVERLSDEN